MVSAFYDSYDSDIDSIYDYEVLSEPIYEKLCAICNENLTKCNRSITKCGHQFHTSCLSYWIIKKKQNTDFISYSIIIPIKLKIK